MSISPILSRYLSVRFLMLFLTVLVTLLSIIYIFDTLDLLRRAAKRDVPLSLILQMGLYKMPEVGQLLLPFAILFGAMWTFWTLSRQQELTALRAAGLSAWQFIMPIVATALFVGIVHVCVLNPLTSMLVSQFRDFESQYLGQNRKLVTLSTEGLWLREGLTAEDGENASDDEVIIHAASVNLSDWQLREVMALFFDDNGINTVRIDSAGARLEEGEWVFESPVLTKAGLQSETLADYRLPTSLTLDDIRESFSDPDSISFWKLPSFIETLQETGLATAPMEVYYQNLLAMPALFAAMVLLAATVSLRPPRFARFLPLFSIGAAGGFGVFFLSGFLKALGSSEQIPIFLASWAPASIVTLLSVTYLLNAEDG